MKVRGHGGIIKHDMHVLIKSLYNIYQQRMDQKCRTTITGSHKCVREKPLRVLRDHYF